MAQQWGLVVPVKLLGRAKTRLSAFGDRARADLALAFAVDVVEAALACPPVGPVLVVTDDRWAARVLDRPGVRVVPDLPDAGLNPALEHGARLLLADWPQLGLAALPADLPALRPADLAAALRAVRTRGFVADAGPDGGTTMLAALPGHPLRPMYGPGSRHRHLLSGATPLPAAPSLRRDVDTPANLATALRLGVGPATAGVVAGLTRAVRPGHPDRSRPTG